MDELTSAEHWALYEALADHPTVDGDAEFLYAGLEEPPKAEVLAWRPGMPFSRRARVHFAKDHVGYEALVDITAGQVGHQRGVD